MNQNSVSKHILSILIFPVNVLIVIPSLILTFLKVIPLFESSSYIKIIATLCFIIGLSLMISTIYLFRTVGKGTLSPWNPTQKLVVEGPYKYCRNPMITGVLCVLIAESLWFNNLILLVCTFLFFAFCTTYFVFKEEPQLAERFGEDYIHYKKHVPRWLPKIKPYKS